MNQLDESKYKEFTTSRNLKYHYFVQAPVSASTTLPTLLFLHGFPNHSGDWYHQATYFSQLGYRVIVPDLLGYAGTDKPTDVKFYGMKGMATDVKEILDAEAVEKAVVIGHDWGSGLTSRFAQYYPERTIALGFFAVGYYLPSVDFDYEKMLEMCRAATGSDVFGYWKFFCEDNAEDILLGHIDATFCTLFPENPELWREAVAPLGALKKHLLEDKRNPIAPYISPTEVEARKQLWKKDGFKAATCWYKAFLDGVTPTEDAEIPLANYTYSKPVFFGAALKDCVCIAPLNEQRTRQSCPDTTVVQFDADHWVPLAKPKEVNEALEVWLKEKVVTSA